MQHQQNRQKAQRKLVDVGMAKCTRYNKFINKDIVSITFSTFHTIK